MLNLARTARVNHTICTIRRGLELNFPRIALRDGRPCGGQTRRPPRRTPWVAGVVISVQAVLPTSSVSGCAAPSPPAFRSPGTVCARSRGASGGHHRRCRPNRAGTFHLRVDREGRPSVSGSASATAIWSSIRSQSQVLNVLPRPDRAGAVTGCGWPSTNS
jgi:hypothetical protein